MRKDSGARAGVLLALARAARTGRPAPTYAAMAASLGVANATIATVVLKLKRDGKIRVVERRWPSFMRYEVVGIGTTGERPACQIPTSWGFQQKREPTPPTG